MLSRIRSYGLQGIRGFEVAVEIDISSGMPGIEMVGLPDAAIKESRERVRSAIRNSGFLFAPKKITVNLAPADVKKEGAMYDLPIAVGMLAATDQIPQGSADDTIIVGELSLYGEIRQVKGIMPIIIAARACGCKTIIVPKANEKEASFVDGIDVFAFETLRHVVDFLQSRVSPCVPGASISSSEGAFGSAGGQGAFFEPVKKQNLCDIITKRSYKEDFRFVKGQYAAKRALEIAAAGGHNILMIGPPGGGKTMLAKCLPTILPDLGISEALETTKIHSVAGCLDENIGIITHRPFRTPHHTASRISLTGGGSTARPGEISLAHNGVLFLDELPEYPRASLEILRQPLEDNVIIISRASRSIEYPASFMLVASMNPCPCGKLGGDDCICTPAQITKYISRLSGPLMDRIDLHIEVGGVSYDELTSSAVEESSAQIKQRVNKARAVQVERFERAGIYCNARMNNALVSEFCRIDAQSDGIIKSAFQRLGLSARAYSRILKVARTIADLAGCAEIQSAHIAEAIGYRTLDRGYSK